MPSRARGIQGQYGFSLAELSIVLVIMGLLVGGVLLGQDFIRSAEIRSVIGDVEKLTKAFHAFQDKYNALPGDMYNATTLWGADAGCTATPSNTVRKAATCNGNGDRKIGWYRTGIGTAQEYEQYRQWQQLANAGMIDGMYTGVTGPGSATDEYPGLNVPASRIPGAGFGLGYGEILVTDPVYFDTSGNGHFMLFGTKQTPGSMNQPAISASEASDLDIKLDDGNPAHGRVMALLQIVTPDCITDDDPALAAYNVSNVDVTCSLVLKMDF